MSIDQIITIGTTASGTEWRAYPDRHTLADVRTMAERIVQFGGTVSAEAQALLAELDAEVADAQAQPAATVVTVALTNAQAARLDELLPESLLGLEVLATRVKGTREQLADALEFVDVDTALELAMPGFDVRNDEEEAFAERAVRRSVKALRRKLADAARR